MQDRDILCLLPISQLLEEGCVSQNNVCQLHRGASDSQLLEVVINFMVRLSVSFHFCIGSSVIRVLEEVSITWALLSDNF